MLCITKILIAAFALVVVVIASPCTVVPRPCDGTWKSGLNQTFAFLAVGQPNFVQLRAFWGGSVGCTTSLPSEDGTGVQMSWLLCSKNTSVWGYGPGAIVGQYVYYKNLGSGNCLTLKVNVTDPATSSTIVAAPCCSATNSKCTAAQAAAQMWMEPASTTNPYVRIQSKTMVTSDTAFCLTRVGDAC